MGAIKSATVMTNMPYSEQALKYAALHSQEYSFGLHFNIAEGRPHLRIRENSLTGPDGLFASAYRQRINLLLGRFSPEHVAGEMELQLAIMTDYGVKISHVDSHGHMHKFPSVFRAILPALKKFGINQVRRPQNLFINRSTQFSILNSYCARAFKGVNCTEDFAGIKVDFTKTWWHDLADRLQSENLELGIHPGLEEGWRRYEAEPFLDGRFATILAERGFENCSYWDLDFA